MPRVKEISVGISGTIPVASFENLKPHFGMTVEILDGESEHEAFAMARATLRNMFEDEANRAKVDLIQKQYSTIRFYEHEGKRYPSVTSILGWDIDWKVSEDSLRQYQSRGTIVHKIVELYIKDGKWVDPKDIPELNEDVAIVLSGSEGLHWDTCSHRAFFEKYGKDFKFLEVEKTVVNKTHEYGGRLDYKVEYKGELALADLKTGDTSDFRQLSAYAKCEPEEFKKLIILPVGVTDNKCGYMQPKICTTIDSEFDRFLKARSKFRSRFGV